MPKHLHCALQYTLGKKIDIKIITLIIIVCHDLSGKPNSVWSLKRTWVQTPTCSLIVFSANAAAAPKKEQKRIHCIISHILNSCYLKQETNHQKEKKKKIN